MEKITKTLGKIENAIFIWFNPPCSKPLKTNIGKYCFRLLNKHFPPGHKAQLPLHAKPES